MFAPSISGPSPALADLGRRSSSTLPVVAIGLGARALPRAVHDSRRAVLSLLCAAFLTNEDAFAGGVGASQNRKVLGDDVQELKAEPAVQIRIGAADR